MRDRAPSEKAVVDAQDPSSPIELKELSAERMEDLYRFFTSRLSETSQDMFMPHFKWRPLALVAYRHLCRQGTRGTARYWLVYVRGDPLPMGLILLRGIGNRTAELGIGLADAYHGRGWGVRLMEILLERAREMRLEKLVLTYHPRNPRSGALYRRFGFVETGAAWILTGRLWPRREIRMERDL